jgi:hypothetical protein
VAGAQNIPSTFDAVMLPWYTWIECTERGRKGIRDQGCVMVEEKCPKQMATPRVHDDVRVSKLTWQAG